MKFILNVIGCSPIYTVGGGPDRNKVTNLQLEYHEDGPGIAQYHNRTNHPTHALFAFSPKEHYTKLKCDGCLRPCTPKKHKVIEGEKCSNFN
jgi:hypothetical protein